jgi:hypothetical protein
MLCARSWQSGFGYPVFCTFEWLQQREKIPVERQARVTFGHSHRTVSVDETLLAKGTYVLQLYEIYKDSPKFSIFYYSL